MGVSGLVDPFGKPDENIYKETQSYVSRDMYADSYVW